MGRKKLDGDYRQRYEEKHPGRKHTSGKSGKRHTKSRNGFFVAWDGEGRDTDELLPNKHTVRMLEDFAHNKKTDEIEMIFGRSEERQVSDTPIYRHEMNVLAFSNEDGSISGVRNENRRLTTGELLDFIGIGVKTAGRLAIHVSFSFTYDVTHILYDLPREEIHRALSERRKHLSDYGRWGEYIVKYRPRKQLYIGKLRNRDAPFVKDRTGKWHLDLDWSVTLYDTFGFFQCGFAKACEIWGVGTNEELSTINEGKEGRAFFNQWSSASIIAYNNLELVLLCTLMAKVRSALQSTNLYLSRWDGAGAVASALYQKELPKRYIRSIQMPDWVERAAYYAYAGGRSECVQQGTYIGECWRYDINSAYPDAMRTIPDLSNGVWEECWNYNELKDFALYHITWNWIDKSEPFLPFFFRDGKGSIYFPPMGENWVWGVELKSAREHCRSLIVEIKECYEFISFSDHRPFAFIEQYYQERLAIKQRLKDGIGTDEDVGKSLVIKLGLNSLYGKTIQKVGVTRDEEGNIQYPPFYNITIGSYITAYTRAKLYSIAAANKAGIVLFATDGIITVSKLEPYIATALGAWEQEQLDGVMMLQAGIYWTLKDGEWSEKSRGIDRGVEKSDDRRTAVQEGWKTKSEKVSFPLRRFLGIKYSSLTEERWALRGAWVTDTKDVKLHDAGVKRLSTPRNERLDKHLFLTGINWPDTHQSEDGDIGMSNPRPLPQPEENEEEMEE